MLKRKSDVLTSFGSMRCSIQYRNSYLTISRSWRLLSEAPIALISMVDERRQWFKSRFGTTIEETSRDVSLVTLLTNRADSSSPTPPRTNDLPKTRWSLPIRRSAFMPEHPSSLRTATGRDSVRDR